MPGSSFDLAVSQPFSFARCLEYMTRSPLESLYEVRSGSVIRLLRAAREPDSDCGAPRSYLVDITCPDDQALHVRFLQGKPDSDEELEGVKRYIREWFDLDRDLEPWQQLVADDPVLGKLAAEFYGLRLIGIPDLYEALCWAIAGQQVNLPFAYKLKARLAETYGKSVIWEGRRYWRFPDPSALAGADIAALQSLQLTRAKSAAIIETASRMTSGELSRAGLLGLGDFASAEQALVHIRGIGPWTANYVRMRCLRDPSAFPIGDVGLQNAVRSQLSMDRKPTPAELRELFAPWAGWEAYATFYLWHSLY
ncbi:DNA-3-methyladenine glycosylase family protein [Paenibacillus sp. GCM10012307]|uniref:DNA-3-methyladenine glycosylase II n=1 Tax=Paenibacillus roseus TaxID=2798579 RepID=A0A934IXS4_9BACL|nr:DNA-3-methyladenine glycosylase [Paenibacillus roseus]MBJ6361217.1 DNA-3-methyladenine glycosylase 2 family protein [Paenibacillus roseus]